MVEAWTKQSKQFCPQGKALKAMASFSIALSFSGAVLRICKGDVLA